MFSDTQQVPPVSIRTYTRTNSPGLKGLFRTCTQTCIHTYTGDLNAHTSLDIRTFTHTHSMRIHPYTHTYLLNTCVYTRTHTHSIGTLTYTTPLVRTHVHVLTYTPGSGGWSTLPGSHRSIRQSELRCHRH